MLDLEMEEISFVERPKIEYEHREQNYDGDQGTHLFTTASYCLPMMQRVQRLNGNTINNL